MTRRFLLPGLAILLGLFCATYIADTLVARIRLGINREAELGTVTVYYGAALRGNKYTIFGGQPDTVTCVRALFGHFGYPSCWYQRGRNVNIE